MPNTHTHHTPNSTNVQLLHHCDHTLLHMSCGKEEDVGTFASAGIACKWQYTWHRLRTKDMKSLEVTVVLLAAEKPYLICTVEKLPDVKYITSFAYFCQAELCRPLKVSSHNWVKLHHKKHEICPKCVRSCHVTMLRCKSALTATVQCWGSEDKPRLSLVPRRTGNETMF